MIEIRFTKQKRTACVEVGTTILDAARSVDVVIESPCDGIGTCGKCKVRVLNFSTEMVEIGHTGHRLKAEEASKGYVLACQARALLSIDVEYENTQRQNKTLRILSDGKSFQYAIWPFIRKEFDGANTLIYGGSTLLGTETGDTRSSVYGCSIDIGTTTIVVALVDIQTGEELASVSALNPQSLHAQDVLTRIKMGSDQKGLDVLYNGVLKEMRRMIAQAANDADVSTHHIYEVVYSGNTTMIHLACNVDPFSLGKYPYTPVIRGGREEPSEGLQISPYGRIYLPPVISAYVGPDITSGVLASQLHKQKGTVLFIDIGTNGEMVIARDARLCATSTAAGPAFEGMNISCGMRAGEGAIELFRIEENGDVTIRTIGEMTPTGICGSGLLDIVGELVRTGVIAKNGRLVPPDKVAIPALKQRLVEVNGKLCFEVAEGIYLTQNDIRQVQLAKGAVRAGVEALLAGIELAADDVDRVEIAGSFGYHLRADSLMNMGLLPRAFEGKIEFVGNTSKTGGKAFLLNTLLRKEMEDLVSTIEVVELANRPDFEKVFVKAMSF